MSMKNSNDTIGNRTLEVSACYVSLKEVPSACVATNKENISLQKKI
jgi:hypothetical protein